MEIIKGKNASAHVYSSVLDEYAAVQIKNICDNDVSIGQKICIMPDVHPGFVAPIGLSMTVGEKVLPNLVGIDVGCGMTIAKIAKQDSYDYILAKSVMLYGGVDITDKILKIIK